MKKKFTTKKKMIFFGILFLACILFYLIFGYGKKVENPQYGVSFNTIYAQELGLNWQEVYDALFEELGVQKIRLAAHWNMIEPKDNTYNFTELDYQIERASAHDAEIIMALGKRLPRWPECHIPDWALNLSKEQQEKEILEYIEHVINRYKSNSSIKIWQVENEPFLSMFAKSHCYNFDEKFLEKEIELVRSLDEQKRPILITDSGELSTWRKAFSHGDIFGTTMYVYSWNEFTGEFRNLFLPGFYTFRSNFWNLFQKDKPSIIAELSLEPWLDKPVIKEKTEIQIHRMSPEKFENVLDFAKHTGMHVQYVWGAEWWYYMKLQGEDWYWQKGKELFYNR
jgi:hypothetical protein